MVKQSTANTLSVAQAVKEELVRVSRDLPEGMKLQVAFDSSIFIERSIDAVYRTMLEAVALVVLVIFVFLRSVRSTLIPFVTIPVSLVGSFFFLYVLGFSINVLTLLGVVLAIGLVVDDAIVVLENCHRHLEMGKPPQQAAADGSREIAFAVIAMSLTLTAVFAPVAFVPGNTGRLFAEFALTVASAVAVSGFVALTLTPMMCSRVLKAHERHGGLYLAMERFFTGMTNAYRRSVTAGAAQVVGGAAGLRRRARRLHRAGAHASSRSFRRWRTGASSCRWSSRRKARRWTTPTPTCAKSSASTATCPRSAPPSRWWRRDWSARAR